MEVAVVGRGESALHRPRNSNSRCFLNNHHNDSMESSCPLLSPLHSKLLLRGTDVVPFTMSCFSISQCNPQHPHDPEHKRELSKLSRTQEERIFIQDPDVSVASCKTDTPTIERLLSASSQTGPLRQRCWMPQINIYDQGTVTPKDAELE